MKKTILVSLSTALAVSLGGLFIEACGSSNSPAGPSGSDSGPDTTTTTPPIDSGAPGLDAMVDAPASYDSAVSDSGNTPETGTDAGIPAPPTLGAQIDRFGRPAINTALNHSFDSNAATAGTAKDTYNADTDASSWVASYASQFAGNLAILDSLDTTADGGVGCGNQPYAQLDAGAARYHTLSGLLADDRMWVNTASTTCTQYLAVELNATNVLVNSDCGGRKLTYDVIQTTYSIAAGVGLSGFGSGVGAVASKTNGASFPYLAAPQ